MRDRPRRDRPTASRYGDVTDFANFMGAVIDDRAFAKHAAALDRVKNVAGVHGRSPAARADDSEGYFVRPTVARDAPTRPTRCSRREYFGPILAVHVYDDSDFDRRAHARSSRRRRTR